MIWWQGHERQARITVVGPLCPTAEARDHSCDTVNRFLAIGVALARVPMVLMKWRFGRSLTQVGEMAAAGVRTNLHVLISGVYPRFAPRPATPQLAT